MIDVVRYDSNSHTHSLSFLHNSKPPDKAATAKKHLQHVETLLGNIHASLAKIAATAPHTKRSTSEPSSAASPTKKRKTTATDNNTATTTTSTSTTSTTAAHHHHHNNNDPNIHARTVRAMEQLQQFVLDKGGSASMLDGFTATVHQRGRSNKYDVNFYYQQKKFRSMLQVGRELGLLETTTTTTTTTASRNHRKAASKEQVAAKKKLRKELERLRKAQTRATKALDEWNDDTEQQPPEAAGTNDSSAQHDGNTAYPIAAARIPDATGFAGFSTHCTPGTYVCMYVCCCS